MRRLGFGLLVLMSTFELACGDDGGEGAETEGTTTTGGATTMGGTTGATTYVDTSTGSGVGTSGSTGGVDTGDTTDTGTDTGGPDCDNLPPGPFSATELPALQFDGSEDIGFDGQGHIVGRDMDDVVALTPDGQPTTLGTLNTPTYGMRFRADGDLLAAGYDVGTIFQIAPAGEVTQFMTDVGGVNGLYPDFDDSVWYTNFQIVGRINSDMTSDTIVSGADGQGANGVVFDPDRGLLFYTNYGMGFVRRVPIDGQGNPGTIELVGDIPGAPDGLSLDACGNLYVVDQQQNMIYRFFLDEMGVADGDAEPLLEAPTSSNIANAQFGSGTGFDASSLYAAGNPGTVYRIEVGVPGAPYPTPG